MPAALTSDRVVAAVLANIDSWEQAALEIADDLEPGSKVKALSLAKDLLEAKLTLERLTEEPAPEPADD